MQQWQTQRDQNIAAKQAHMAAVLSERHQSAMAQSAMNVSHVLPQNDETYTPLQLELFATNPVDFDFIESKLAALPRQRQREHFRKLYLQAYRSIKDDGSIAFQLGNRQRRHANDYLREVMDVRLQKVFTQYNVNVDVLQAFIRTPKWLQELQVEIKEEWEHRFNPHRYYVPTREDIAEQHNELHKLGFQFERYGKYEAKIAKLPFYLLTESKLKTLAEQIATAFSTYQFESIRIIADYYPKQSATEINARFFELYKKCGEIAASFGFEIPHWEKIQAGKNIKGEHIDSTLIKLTCKKYWFNKMRTMQRRMVEHIAIACGEVRAGAAYISNQGYQEWQLQQRKNYDYLRAMIIENIDNPEEQAELFYMFLKSSANPALRRNEMMVRLRGLEEWAEENGNVALFLTLTAPSSFHAGNSQKGFNKKWQGADPRATQCYLNGVWRKLRAQYAKRGIKIYGMRVAEPHKDGTPHWHLLAYVKAEHKDEVIRLFQEKALEIDGTEKGAQEHRCKIEECDKKKGSATGYISKYISKNIDGFALNGEMSDEDPTVNLKNNARRARAWASCWGIRQFQFYGGASISVWRELRRLVSGQADDEIIAKAQAAAGVANDYAAYMEIQGGALAKRLDQPVRLNYEIKEPNQYGETRKAITGLINPFSLKFVISRTKRWTIKKRPQGFVSSTSSTVERSSTTKSGLCPPWTCVSNCNRSEIEQKIKNLTVSICAPLSDEKINYLLRYKRLNLNKYQALTLIDDDVQLTERNQNMITSFGATSSRIQKLKNLHKKRYQ